MGLERIDRAIYTTGGDTDFDADTRRFVLGKLGIPAEKVTTEHGGNPLTRAQATAEVLSDRLEEAPDALDLIVFSGRVDDGWQTLVAKAYELIGQKAGHTDLMVHLAALDEIFSQINAVRAAFSMSREFHPANAAKQIENTVPKLPNTLVQAVRKRFALLMLSDGESFVRAGQLAAHFGVIDGAFDTLETASDPAPVIRHLEECLRSRGL